MPRTSFAILIGSVLVACIGCGQTAPPNTCALKLELVDSQTNELLPGIVRLRGPDEKPIEPAELVNRGQGIEQQGPIHTWFVLPKPTTIRVPAGPITCEALSGLETELAETQADLTGKSSATLRIPLTRFHQARKNGYVAGNTHLHLMKMSKPQADRYLAEVPLVDGLDIVFLSYLERAEADLDYTSNKYTPDDLKRMSHDHVHFGHGEEHRHNFHSHGEGYGHILLLDIPYIIRPVSVGPGIMREGPDAPPMQRGIDEARRAGGKVVWAHNLFGLEDIPNWLTGRVHANNIFDGSAKGSYKNTYYRYLNVGLSVPFSTGTDWFIYDLSRVYVMTNRAVTPTEWLDLLAAGKTYITNGPLLEFTVNEQPIGSKLELNQPMEVKISGRAIGRLDFKRIELVQNGRVIGSAPAEREDHHFVAKLDATVRVDAPAWFALRTPPPPVANDPELQEPVGKNEFDGNLFAHTSPIYVEYQGQRMFDRPTAIGLLEEMKADVKQVEAQAQFADDAQRQSVLGVYQEAIELLEKRLEEPAETSPSPEPAGR